MKQHQHQPGFTIVEVLVGLFVIAGIVAVVMVMLGSRHKAENFNQGGNKMAAVINDSLSQALTNKLPDFKETCKIETTSTGTADDVFEFATVADGTLGRGTASPSTTPGTTPPTPSLSESCAYIGRMIQIARPPAASSYAISKPSNHYIDYYLLADLVSVSEIGYDFGTGAGGVEHLSVYGTATKDKKWPNGFSITKAHYSGSTKPVQGFAVVHNNNGGSGSASYRTNQSGSGGVGLYVIREKDTSTRTERLSKSDFVDDISRDSGGWVTTDLIWELVTTPPIYLCVSDGKQTGGSDNLAVIIIGEKSGGGSITARVSFKKTEIEDTAGADCLNPWSSRLLSRTRSATLWVQSWSALLLLVEC